MNGKNKVCKQVVELGKLFLVSTGFTLLGVSCLSGPPWTHLGLFGIWKFFGWKPVYMSTPAMVGWPRASLAKQRVLGIFGDSTYRMLEDLIPPRKQVCCHPCGGTAGLYILPKCDMPQFTALLHIADSYWLEERETWCIWFMWLCYALCYWWIVIFHLLMNCVYS